MTCYKPTRAHVGNRLTPNGKKDILFNEKLDSPLEVLHVPCGHCIGCQLDKSRSMAMRCMHEAQLYDDNCYLTLTYSDQNLPGNNSLVKKHFKDFMKRLRGRKEFQNKKIRYYYCGEYGDKLGRPHYHAIIFNIDFADKLLYKTLNDHKLYTSELLDNIWELGHCFVGSVTFQSAAYVARYVMKKVYGDQAKWHYNHLLPEYTNMSLKPGIGAKWLEKYKTDVFPHDHCIVDGHKVPVPKYYDTLLDRESPTLLEALKTHRVLDAEIHASDNTPERLKAREICKQAQIKSLKRDLPNEEIET